MQRKTTFFLTFCVIAMIVLYSLQSVPSGHSRESAEKIVAQQTVLGNGVHATAKAGGLFTPPFRTAGRHIVDSNGERVKLASVNWYGASDLYFVAGGLDVRHRDEIAATIVGMGFNSVRFPYSDQMVLENPIVPPELIAANLDLLDDHDITYQKEGPRSDTELRGPRALDVFNACVKSMTDAGLIVIINNHITNAAWCDGKNLCDSIWKNNQYGPICKIKQTTESWIENWKTIMLPFVNDPLVMGADLRNEPRGIWGTLNWNMWATAAEKASEALLSIQPDWLMFIEGISSANDCSGARDRPIELSVPDRVVYSSHVYAWSGWGKLSQFNKRPYPSFALEMEHNWGYLINENTAPVWVGEFGAPHNAGEGDHHYWNSLVKYLEQTDADFGYWALNPRKPANYDNETYGLLKDDWKTPIKDWRYFDLKRLMTPDS